MERLLIFLAVLVLVVAGTLVGAMMARGRRPPLQMDSEFLPDDTDVLVGPLRRASPIDRSAQVLDASSGRTEGHGTAPQGTVSGDGR